MNRLSDSLNSLLYINIKYISGSLPYHTSFCIKTLVWKYMKRKYLYYTTNLLCCMCFQDCVIDLVSTVNYLRTVGRRVHTNGYLLLILNFGPTIVYGTRRRSTLELQKNPPKQQTEVQQTTSSKYFQKQEKKQKSELKTTLLSRSD